MLTLPSNRVYRHTEAFFIIRPSLRGIAFRGSPVPFKSLGLHEDLCRAVEELGFTRPTPIQEQAIPIILKGKDVVGGAQTGTGKTAAFLLPLLHRLITRPGRGGTRVLVLTPTRELALQIEDDFRDYSRFTHLRGTAVYGGVGFAEQTKALVTGADVIIATPGRLLDHMHRGHAKLGHMEALVLDEADRMLDMGFLPDLKRILARLPRERQTLLFSATVPPEIEALVHSNVQNPVVIQVGHRAAAAAGIRHAVYPVSQIKKAALLYELIRRGHQSSVLVFTRTRRRAERLAYSLQMRGLRVAQMHSDRSQSQRVHALEGFRSGRYQVLVATDIAARGLDVENITHVINFDAPNTREEYVHRIGRTARAEAEGDAFTLVAPEEERIMKSIEKELGSPLPRVVLPDFDYGPIPPITAPAEPVQQVFGTRRYGSRRPGRRR
ncbi:MAG: DEAD/DEAH box helicase [Planctomycetes bacterium]|nr:DEAD/DEAH box helicase [Planctomycetota bacterium]